MLTSQTISTPNGSCADLDLTCVIRAWAGWNTGHLLAGSLFVFFVVVGGFAAVVAFMMTLKEAPAASTPMRRGAAEPAAVGSSEAGMGVRAARPRMETEGSAGSGVATLAPIDPEPETAEGAREEPFRLFLLRAAMYLAGLAVIDWMMPATDAFLDRMGIWSFLGGSSTGLAPTGRFAVWVTAIFVLVPVVKFITRQRGIWQPILYPFMLMVTSCVLVTWFGLLGALVNGFAPARENLTFFGDSTTTTLRKQQIVPDSVKITHPEVGFLITRPGPPAASGLVKTDAGTESFWASHVAFGKDWTLTATRTCQPVLYKSLLLAAPDEKLSDYCTESSTAVIGDLDAAR